MFIKINLNFGPAKSVLYWEVIFWDKEKWSYNAGDFLKRSLSHSKFSMSGQEKRDILIQVSP